VLLTATAVLSVCLALTAASQNEASGQQQQQPQQQQSTQQLQPQSAEPDGTNNVVISNGDIRLGGSGALLHLDQFKAISVRHISEQGCKQNTIQIHSGRLSLTDEALTQLLNHNFEKKGDSKRIKVTANGDKLKFEGSKAAGMSMTFDAKPMPLGDSRIALIATDIKMEHLPVKGLMHVFGLNMDDLMHSSTKALTVDKDNLIVDLRYASKDTPLEGTVTNVAVQGHRVTITFGNTATKRAANSVPVKHTKLAAKTRK
jgi:lipopolysaccharide export system protein LptA